MSSAGIPADADLHRDGKIRPPPAGPVVRNGSEIELGDRPIVVIADIHGNLDKFEAALKKAPELCGREDFILVTIGDYFDNGPQVPALMERLVQLQADPGPITFLPILGNHDCAGLLAASSEFNTKTTPREWFKAWSHYHNPGGQTYAQYGASGAADWCKKLPEHHKEFLKNLPWYVHLGPYFFVHSGLLPTSVYPVDTQVDFLNQKDTSYYPAGWLPDQMRMKELRRRESMLTGALNNDPLWQCIVVNGHNKYPDSCHQLASHRIALQSGACQGDALHCAVLPPTMDPITGLPGQSTGFASWNPAHREGPGGITFFSIPPQ
eukprot:NODE_766_length_1208_cov_101.517114_g726_i0.p1 GENE.NODE_766_length_1208_cov_101.517114_g726_i0~~NODE_766_length_1208_cov_101.517114_g726_i0.p1  ORF type:complete len:322 (+),score=16.55 NODE_766_length_1208_cov_101.517114_g726_i0:174-1139(+)